MLEELNFQSLVEQGADQMPGFYYAKDTCGRYLFANEDFAAYASCDSNNQLKRKRDNDLPWGQQALLLQKIDHKVVSITGFFQEIVDIHHPEYGPAQFLTTKKRLLDNNGKVCGIVGVSVNLSGQNNYSDQRGICNGRLQLGEEFNNQYLTAKEINVYQTILMGYSAKEAGDRLNISRKTVEFHTEQLRKKLNCHNKGALIRKALGCGFSNTILNYLGL